MRAISAGLKTVVLHMTMTSRKRRPLDRLTAVRDARLIVVATEGAKTEPSYFAGFHSIRIKIKTIPCVNGQSSPASVLARLLEFRQEFELDDDDELWLVIDRDKWTEAMLSDVAQRCQNSRVNLAVSNPCFEVWLALHYTSNIPPDLRSTDAPEFFSNLHGSYSKSSFDPSGILHLLPAAIANAQALDVNPTARWPTAVGSHVYRLANVILPFLA